MMVIDLYVKVTPSYITISTNNRDICIIILIIDLENKVATPRRRYVEGERIDYLCMINVELDFSHCKYGSLGHRSRDHVDDWIIQMTHAEAFRSNDFHSLMIC
jgi:hypothetical protein